MTNSEQELILRSAQGDRQAFGQLYEAYLDQIYRYVFLRTGDAHEAEDLSEEVFLKAWEALPKTRKGNRVENFRSWVYRIAHNLVVDRYRSKKTTLPLQDALMTSDENLLPESVIQQREQNHHLASVLNKLEEPFREVILHRFVHQLSHDETARVMGLRTSHVRVLQYRALKKMRLLLKEV
jgi:RNA polymerase sigma-70 factor (ECF subfamily)